MKWLLISDTHSNLEALEAVLGGADYDRVAFLGDAVDYGPDPELAVDVLQRAAKEGGVFVRGNHDEAVATPPEEFDDAWWSSLASATMKYSRSRLRPDQTAFLGRLPTTATLDLGAGGRALLCHGTPSSNREYLWPDLPDPKLQRLLRDDAAEFTYLFVGHSHLQFTRTFGALTIANPGSVGQPRDGDPQAAFATADTDEGKIAFHRVPYKIEATAAKIRKREMPFADRLVGILERGGG